MLIITFHNDGTGYPDVIGNYDYRVYINRKLIAEGRIEKYNRAKGWQGLVRELANKTKRENGGNSEKRR